MPVIMCFAICDEKGEIAEEMIDSDVGGDANSLLLFTEQKDAEDTLRCLACAYCDGRPGYTVRRVTLTYPSPRRLAVVATVEAIMAADPEHDDETGEKLTGPPIDVY